MTQWLKESPSLSENLCLVPSTHLETHYICTPVPGDLTPSAGVQKHQAYMWYTNMDGDETPIHVK